MVGGLVVECWSLNKVTLAEFSALPLSNTEKLHTLQYISSTQIETWNEVGSVFQSSVRVSSELLVEQIDPNERNDIIMTYDS